ncbi:MFS transporter [Streptomyces sp. MST-110588]|uniref:MFS transporter n=1 Tax=Streptomyces sp. MST-110588 TaxID=2833628 RepID=UPI001F5D8DF5|nr:MFS transporter [Streptomyces sp. MST-110588]
MEPAAHEAATDDPLPPGPGRVRIVFLGLLLLTALAVLDQTTVAAALPGIVGELRGADRAPWVVTAHLLASTVLLPVYGKLGDLVGRKPVLLFAVLVFLTGSALAGRAGTMDELVVFRAVQGAGAGGLLVGVHAVVADLVPSRARGRFMGLIAAVFGSMAVAGPLLGSLVTDHVSWRWCFYANLPVGLAALLIVLFALTTPRPRPSGRPGLDVTGALLLGAFSTFVVLMVNWGGLRYAWDSRIVLGLAAGALGTGMLFVTAEYFAAEPLIPLRLFRDPVFVVTTLLGAVSGVAFFGAATCLPAFFQMVDGSSVTRTVVLMLPLMGGVALTSLLCGLLVSRTGRYTVFPLMGCAVASVAMWLLSHLDADTPRPVFSIWTGILGAAIGCVLPVLVLAVHNAVAPADVGTVTGAHLYLRQIGGSACAAAFGTLFARRLGDQLTRELPGPTRLPHPESLTAGLVQALPAALRDGIAAAYAHAVPRMFFHLAPVLVLGFVLAVFLKEKPLVSHAPHAPHQVPPAAEVPQPSYAGRPDTGAAYAPPQDPGVPYARTTPEAGPPVPPPGAPYGGLVPGVPVCGTVQHHDGTIVPRAALTLIDVTGRQIGRGATGEDGRYALSTPGTGSYVLIASAGGHQPQAVSVTVGERPVELDVVLGGAGRLAGTVTTADGTPVRDAIVTLTDVRGEVVATTRSGREGGYVIAELVAGEYTLASSAPAFRPAALPVTVQASRETRQDIELAGGAVLRGTVRATGGRTVEDARVTLLDAAGNVVDTATTGADGRFRFVDLSAGEYTVIASGYPPVATVLQIAGGGRTERDLQLGYED